jgi:hypothetical protein
MTQKAGLTCKNLHFLWLPQVWRKRGGPGCRGWGSAHCDVHRTGGGLSLGAGESLVLWKDN